MQGDIQMNDNNVKKANTSTSGTDGTNRAPYAPTGLLTNESEYPLNIEGSPLFGWWVNDPDQDDYQTAYEIRLYDGITDVLLWDSGKVRSDNQSSILYTGAPLKHGYPYSWEVKTWDSHDAESPFSERAYFATGLENSDWEAFWIRGVDETGAPLTHDNCYWCSRKEIKLENRGIKKAFAYVSGCQDYELSVNGVRIGRAQTFDYLGETKYQGWDITEAIEGADSMAIGILACYYGGGQGRAVTCPGLIGKFIIYYADGTTRVTVTDESWLTHGTGYYNVEPRNSEGDEIEYCDARRMILGWSEVGYDTAGWVPVAVHGKHPTTKFTSLEAEVGKVSENIVPCLSVTKLADGTTLADFGRIIPAEIIIHFPEGKDGTVITVQEGYELKEDGSIDTSIQATQHTNMTYVYTMKDGEQTFTAWSYLGFRYVSVPKEAGELSTEDFKAIILHAEVVSGRESTLRTSSPMLNDIFELFKRSALYSVQNQFVDTPTREKGQFLVDAVNSSASTTSGSYERQMTRKAILQFLDSSRRHWSDERGLGMYNAVYPNIEGCRGIPDFSLNLPLLVWRYYMLTADKVLLRTAYPYMKNTADFLTRSINPETGLVSALYGGGDHRRYSEGIIDSPPGRFGYDWAGTLHGARTTVNALGVRVYDLLSKMAKELDEGADADLYAAARDRLKTAMNDRLLTEDGVYCDGLTPEGARSLNASQHSSSHAIMADVPIGDTLDSAADHIASLGMRQSPMTADILLLALFKSGRTDAAMRLLTNTEDFGWAKLISEGYTYTWENWQGGSQSHGWGSASLWQLIEYISGVKLIKAGAEKILIAPAIGAVEWAESHTVTARGAVDISYRGSGKEYTITVDIPTNMTAEILFPKVEDGSFMEINGKGGETSFADGRQIVTVGSGRRSFLYRKNT